MNNVISSILYNIWGIQCTVSSEIILYQNRSSKFALKDDAQVEFIPLKEVMFENTGYELEIALR